MLSYLGTGVQHPARITEQGRAALVTGTDAVAQSCRRAIGTPKGTVFGNREYGSYCRLCLFEPHDAILYSLLDYFIGEALEWEPRVRYAGVEIEATPKTLICRVSCELRASNEIFSFDYEFNREN